MVILEFVFYCQLSRYKPTLKMIVFFQWCCVRIFPKIDHIIQVEFHYNVDICCIVIICTSSVSKSSSHLMVNKCTIADDDSIKEQGAGENLEEHVCCLWLAAGSLYRAPIFNLPGGPLKI